MSTARSKLLAGGTCLVVALALALAIPVSSGGTKQSADLYLIPGGPGDSGALLATSLAGFKEFNGVSFSPNPDFLKSAEACDVAAPDESLPWDSAFVGQFQDLLSDCLRSIESDYKANRQVRAQAYKDWITSHPNGVVLAISYGYNLIPEFAARTVAIAPQIRPVDSADLDTYRASFDQALTAFVSECENRCGLVEEIDWGSVGWLTQTALAQALLDPDKFRPLIESSLRKVGSGATTTDKTLQLGVLGPEPKFLLATAIRCLDGWPSPQPSRENSFGSNVVKMLSLCPERIVKPMASLLKVEPLVVRGKNDPYPFGDDVFRIVPSGHDVLASEDGREAVASAIRAATPGPVLPSRGTIIWPNVFLVVLVAVLGAFLVRRSIRWAKRLRQQRSSPD